MCILTLCIQTLVRKTHFIKIILLQIQNQNLANTVDMKIPIKQSPDLLQTKMVPKTIINQNKMVN